MWVDVSSVSLVAKDRLFFVIIFIIFVYAIIVFRLFDIMIRCSESNVKITETSKVKIPFRRLDILDRNGVLLSGSIPTVSLYMNPLKIRDHDFVISSLYKIFPELKKDKLLKMINSKKQFVWIKRHLIPVEQNKVLRIGIPGIYMVSDEYRVYPHSSLFSHIIGYTDTDSNGLAGIERYFEKRLHSSNDLDYDTSFLKLSVDIRLQYIIHNVLSSFVADYTADGAVSILMDIDNCEILSMVSLPDFDANNPVKNNKESLFNKASLGVYEMGSVFKSFTIASAIDSGFVDLNDVFEIKKYLKISNRVIHDYVSKDTLMTVEDIFVHSSNIGTAKIAMKMGSDVQIKYLQQLGFFDNLSIELLECTHPILPQKSKWNNVVVSTVSYGHGISITPIHLVEGIASVIGNGCRCNATLLQKKSNIEHQERIFKKSTVDTMRYLFNMVVRKGTGMRAKADGYEVGGKSGSADKVVAGAYSKDSGIVSFVSVLPIDNPKYLLFVMIDNPKKNENYKKITGGYMAAPVVSKIIGQIAPILNISPF